MLKKNQNFPLFSFLKGVKKRNGIGDRDRKWMDKGGKRGSFGR